MMSILLLTLLSKLHCHPPVIGSVSLLPVEYVVWSLVRKVLPLLLKSFESAAFVKFVGRGVLLVPAAVKIASQSMSWVVPPTLVVVLDKTSPSSWNSKSCTASTTMPLRAAAARRANMVTQRFRQRPRDPMFRFAKLIDFLAILASC